MNKQKIHVYNHEYIHLPQFEMIGGSREVLEFEFWYTDGTSYDFDSSGGSVVWEMARYGEPDTCILRIPMIVESTTNRAHVFLPSESTKYLEGKFIHQPVIYDYRGVEYRTAEGVLIIKARIGDELYI